jgi:ATP-dependent phosphofructokinase / diphosphate-dependent phosphofructokinase
MRGYEDVVLIEAMGRHSGWLAASTQLARSPASNAPHVVLTPEAPIDEGALMASIRRHHARDGLCVVTVAEGVRDGGGAFLAERCPDHDVERDASGQVILGRSGGPLPYLASLMRERLGLRCRLVRPDVLQRASRRHVTEVDRIIAALAGAAAVDHAIERSDRSPVMIALRHEAGAWRTEAVPLERIQGERLLPPDLQADASPLGVLTGCF